MRNGRTIAAAVLSLAMAALAWGPPSSASASEAGVTAQAVPSAAVGDPAAGAITATNVEHCNIVLRKLRPGQKTSDVVSRDCDTDPVALAKRAPQAELLLARLFQHRGWQGNWSNMWGYDGPCDYAGYNFSTVFENGWIPGISSYFVYNGCWSSAIRSSDGALKAFCWDVEYVGDAHNDRVHAISLARPYPGAC
ncbi:hypothetical protein GCM10023170_083890 [Phytohabitans houttuyneae]